MTDRLRPPLEVRTGKHPYELSWLVTALIVATLGLVDSSTRSVAIEGAWPAGLSALFYINLLLGAVVQLAAIIWPLDTTPLKHAWRAMRWPTATFRQRLACAHHSLANGLPYRNLPVLYSSLKLERAGAYITGYSAGGYCAIALWFNGLAGTITVLVGQASIGAAFRIRATHVDRGRINRALENPQPATPPVADPGEA